jgi:hypothetical protein
MERPEWAPAGIDIELPSVARLYDYFLGGFHNFAADRQMAQKVLELAPDIALISQGNRSFLRRAVRYLVSQGIDQFLDLGSGIPTVGNVHEVARELNPNARVVYVDNDPVAVAHSRAILSGDPLTCVVQADVRDPRSILTDPALTRTLDLRRPVGVLMVALLHFVSDDADPAGLVAEVRDATAAGSYLALSHGTDEYDPARSAEVGRLYQNTPTPITLRTRTAIAELLDGFDLVDPGVVHLPLWRPEEDSPTQLDPARFSVFAGVGHRP